MYLISFACGDIDDLYKTFTVACLMVQLSLN